MASAIVLLATALWGGETAEKKADIPQKYQIDMKPVYCRIFLNKSPQERAELVNRVKLVTEISGFAPGKNLPLNEVLMEQAKKAGAKILFASKDSFTFQVRQAHRQGFQVCMPAQNINDVILAILKSVDFILVDGLEPGIVRERLLADYTGKTLPWYPSLNLNQKGNFVLNYRTAVPRTPGSDLRVLTFNLLAETWTKTNPSVQLCLQPRARLVIDFIREFAPDLIGLQEVGVEWYAALENSLEPYRFIKEAAPEHQGKVFCALLYNSECYRQLDGGVFPFTDPRLRCLHWALFENIQTGKRFILTNTHWDLTPEKRMANAKQMVEYIAQLQEKYEVPVICTGDFNADTASTEFKQLLKIAKLQDAMVTAPHKENNRIASCYAPEYQAAPSRDEAQIDHILFSEKVSPLSARLILDETLLLASDHLPLITDFATNSK